MNRTALDAAYEAALDALPPGRHAATSRARRFHVGVVRPDGTSNNYVREGGSSCDHIDAAMEEAGHGGAVRVLPIDDRAPA